MAISGDVLITLIADLHIKIRIIDNECLHLHIPRQVRVNRQAEDRLTDIDDGDNLAKIVITIKPNFPKR